MMGANCRGLVTTDVLLQGLDRGAIATRKLKGVNRDKGHERFILVRPLVVKVKPSPVVVVLLGFDDQGAKYASLALNLLFLALSRRRVVPLYTWVDALRPTESRPAHTNVSGSVTYLTCLTIQVVYTWQFILTGLKPPLGFGPFNKPTT